MHELSFAQSLIQIVRDAFDANLDRFEAHARQMNPSLDIIRVSARTGEGIDKWIAWLEKKLASKVK